MSQLIIYYYYVSLFQSKAKKNGPLKALQPAVSTRDELHQAKMGTSQSKQPQSSKGSHHPHHHNHHHNHMSEQQHRSSKQKSKDDISMARSQKKEKVHANPYATIKMWRPVAMDSASVLPDTGDDVYQSFNNFDALRNRDKTTGAANGYAGVPSTSSSSPQFRTLNNMSTSGRITSANSSSSSSAAASRYPVTTRPSQPVQIAQSRQDVGIVNGPSSPQHSVNNGLGEQMPSSSSTFATATHRSDRPSQRNGGGKITSAQPKIRENGIDIPADYPTTEPASNTRRVSFMDAETATHGKRAAGSKTSPTTGIIKTTPNGPARPSVSPPPPPLPLSRPPSQPNSVPSNTLQVPKKDIESLDSQHDSSFSLVSDGATNSVKLVLSHSYDVDTVDLASKDVERLLAELKYTMDSLKTSRIDKNAAQRAMCLSELQSQTVNFIRQAKLVVSSANSSKAKMVVQLEAAVHTLARLFLHGQASMLMIASSDHAQHLGFHIIKAANAFKATLSAANLAAGKSLNDPQMKYLMRQATNLASLLAALLHTVKHID